MQSTGFVGSTRGVVGVVVAVFLWVVVLVVLVVNLWSSSTVEANVGHVALGMRARGGVGAMDSVVLVVWR